MAPLKFEFWFRPWPYLHPNLHVRAYFYFYKTCSINIDVGRQPWLEGPGLELGLQFTYRVGLVFPTKGSSTPNDFLT